MLPAKGDENPPLKLKVSESTQEDINKGVVRIGRDSIERLGLNPGGDFVELSGNRKTIAIAGPGYPEDDNLDLIRMDGIIRRNADTSIGEMVSIGKSKVDEAQKVTLAPIREDIILEISGDLFREAFIGRPVVKGDVIVSGGSSRRRNVTASSSVADIFNMIGDEGFSKAFFGLTEMKFLVVDTNPKGAVLISEKTELDVKSGVKQEKEFSFPEVSYEDIGGLEDEIKQIREMVELPLKHPEIFKRMGIEAPKGVLLYGPPGTGKTLLAKAVATETKANFMVINGPEITSKYYGESEKHLREIFEEAERRAPSIIFIDEIDAIAPKREEVTGEVERRVVSQINSLMDGLKTRGKVIVIAATNMAHTLDPALRRPGRFDREIEVRAPNKVGRKTILKIHTRNMPLDKNVNLDEIVDKTYGYVGADLESVAKESAMIVMRRVLPDLLKREDTIPEDVLKKLIVKQQDLIDTLKVVRPSAMRELLVEIPNIPFNSVGGLEEIKIKLKESVEWPLKYPGIFKETGIRAPKGTLLYGPPGTGKTLLAKAVATETQSNFILVNGPELLSKWVGESEKAIRKVFEKARQVSPAIIFFDEIDSLAPSRKHRSDSGVSERVVNQLLTEMSGVRELSDVVVLAATNRPDLLDSALLRPGRFDRIIMVKVPDKESRLEILKIQTKDMKLDEKVNLEELADLTENYVGADIEAVCLEAGINMLEENIKNRKVKMKHFMEALKIVKPSVTTDIEENYKRFELEFKKKRGKEMRDETSRSYLS